MPLGGQRGGLKCKLMGLVFLTSAPRTFHLKEQSEAGNKQNLRCFTKHRLRVLRTNTAWLPTQAATCETYGELRPNCLTSQAGHTQGGTLQMSSGFLAHGRNRYKRQVAGSKTAAVSRAQPDASRKWPNTPGKEPKSKGMYGQLWVHCVWGRGGKGFQAKNLTLGTPDPWFKVGRPPGNTCIAFWDLGPKNAWFLQS